MTIKNLKDLEAAIKLCRKHGIETLEVGNIKLRLGDAPVEPQKLKTEVTATPESKDELTPEEQEAMLFWSSQQ